MQNEALLAKDVRVLVLSSGKAGHEANSLGVADALGAPYALRVVAPRPFFARLSPYGPLDPKDRPGRAGSVFAPPFPHIVIACGRITVPYMRAIKQAARAGGVHGLSAGSARFAREHGSDLGARS